MKSKLTWRIWVLIIILILSLLAIFGMPPAFLKKGVVVTSIEQDCILYSQGMKQGEIIFFKSFGVAPAISISIKRFPDKSNPNLRFVFCMSFTVIFGGESVKITYSATFVLKVNF